MAEICNEVDLEASRKLVIYGICRKPTGIRIHSIGYLKSLWISTHNPTNPMQIKSENSSKTFFKTPLSPKYTITR